VLRPTTPRLRIHTTQNLSTSASASTPANRSKKKATSSAASLGITIAAKADIDTLKGAYGKGSAIYVSRPGSSDFADRR
jgi:hypothetical protein